MCDGAYLHVYAVTKEFHSAFLRIMFLRRLEDGRQRHGDSGHPLELPPNFDMTKFHRGRRFFKDNIYSCSKAMFFSLVIGMSIPEFLEALVFTEETNTPAKALKRYLYTYGHVLKWHYGNVWQKDSAAHNSILLVRSMHEKVRNKMHAAKSNKDRLFLSQYDMGVVLSGFMGGVIMYPNFGGIICSRNDLDDYVYFWYAIGYLLGIEDKYNICANGLDYALTVCKEIEQDIVYKSMKTPPVEYTEMTNALLHSVTKGRSLTLLTVPVISALSIDLMEQKIVYSLSFSDTVRYYTWKVIFFSIRHCFFLRNMLNKIVEKAHGLTFVSF